MPPELRTFVQGTISVVDDVARVGCGTDKG